VKHGPDIVAVILAFGIVAVLIMGLWSGSTALTTQNGFPPIEQLDMQVNFWRDILNVMLGALAGYIAGGRSTK